MSETGSREDAQAHSNKHRIGGFYAFILGRNENVSLSVAARSNYEAVKKAVSKDNAEH